MSGERSLAFIVGPYVERKAVVSDHCSTVSMLRAKKNVENGDHADALPRPTHDAAWWEAKTKGFDFSVEDRIDSEKFNRILWEGLMGDKPYPTVRSGADLRRSATPQPDTRQVKTKGGAK